MTVRHPSRKVLDSLRMHIVSNLTTQGWIGSGPRPFAIPASVEVSDALDGKAKDVTDTPVVGVILLGDQPDEEIEVGGSNIETEYEFAVHVFARPGIAAALAEDLRDVLGGRTVPPIVPFHDRAVSPTLVTDEVLELEQVSTGRTTPERADWYLLTGVIRRSHRRAWT